MALGSREFVEEVEKYFDIIEQKRKNKRTELNIPANTRVKLDKISLEDIKDDIIEITVSLHRLYITQETINSLSDADTEKLLKKARLIALTTVCLLFKTYNNKEGENFWQFFSKEVGLSVNDNFYYRILEPALIDEGIIKGNVTRIDSYVDIIAREADISESSLDDIILLFGIYIRYFYPNLAIRDFFRDINEKNSHNVLHLLPADIEKTNVSGSYKRLAEFKEKVILVIHDLTCFNNYINYQEIILSDKTLEQLINNYKDALGHDVSYIFKSEALKEKFIGLFVSTELIQLINLLKKEEPQSEITLPDNTKATAEELLKSESLMYGDYTINEQKITLSINKAYCKNALLDIEKDKIHVYGDKVVIRSINPFDVTIGFSKSLNEPCKFFNDGNFEGYIWYGNRPVTELLSVESDKLEIESLEPTENIISSLNIKLAGLQSKPHFNLDLAYLILVSKENKGKKVEIISTDQTSIVKDFIIDNVGYSGQIVYPIKTKHPGLIDLYLTSDKEILPLKGFEPRLTYELEDHILFDANLKTKISPSDKDIEYSGAKLYLFTTYEFQNNWVNEVCEVNSFQNFGDYNIYEIDWVDRSKPLHIYIDQHFNWIINKTAELHIDSKESHHYNKFIEYKKNIFHNLKDVHLTLSSNESQIPLNEIEIKTSHNYDIVSSNVVIGLINNSLKRNESNALIDEAFIKALLPQFKHISYGRYDFEFSHNSCMLLKFSFFVIPELNIEEMNDVYFEGDDIKLRVTSNVPCFRNGKKSQNYLFDTQAKCNFTINANKLIESKRNRYIKVAKLYNPYTEINIKYEPEVIGYRFMQDNRLYSTDVIDYYNLDKTSFVAKSSQRDVRLKINSNVIKPLVPNNSGIILEPLKSSKENISRNSNDVTIQIGKHDLNFQVLWNTKVTSMVCKNMLYSAEEGISFIMSYEGSNQSQLKFLITDENGKNIDVKKVVCGDDITPKFVRYDRHKNCVFVTCDGRKWENRVFTFYLDAKAVEDSNSISLEGIYEDNREAFGKLIFKNETTNPELKELNSKIKEDINNPYLYFERGFLLSEMNQFLSADADFEHSIGLGLDDEEARGYIEVFRESLSNNLLTYELSQITRLAKKLYTDELLLEVE